MLPVDDDRSTDPTGRILGDYVRRVSEKVVTPPFPGSLVGSGRQQQVRRRRRVLTAGLSAVVVAGVVVVLVAYGPRSADTGSGVTGRPTVTGRPGLTVPSAPVKVRAVTFRGGFQPYQEVGAAGALWLINQTDTTDGSCRVTRFDPVTLVTTQTYALAACGNNVVAGDGQLYLETEVTQPDDSNPIRIETFSLSDHRSKVLTPVAMTVFGSAIAHTQLAFADGWLWLYGPTAQGAEVVKIAPATGAVVATLRGVPEIGGTEPLIVAGPGGVWFSGGPGGSPTLALASPMVDAAGASAKTTLRLVPAEGPEAATVEWMADVEGRLWMGELGGVAIPAHFSHGALAESIVVLGRSGAVVTASPVEDYGQAPVVASGEVLSVGPGGSCDSQPIWRVNGTSLVTTVVGRLRPPFEPCLGQGSYRNVAVAGGAVFVLDSTGGSQPAVLYRIRP